MLSPFSSIRVRSVKNFYETFVEGIFNRCITTLKKTPSAPFFERIMEEKQHEIEQKIFPFLAVILDNCFKLQYILQNNPSNQVWVRFAKIIFSRNDESFDSKKPKKRAEGRDVRSSGSTFCKR